jgi:hypothetical protein
MGKPSGMDEGSLRRLYSLLIQVNQESFAGAEYDVAYHTLSAAAHCAGSIKEIHYLHEVERLAIQQLAWIDAHDPEYEHSTRSASQRGHTSIYKNLANTASAKVLIIENEAKHGRA